MNSSWYSADRSQSAPE
jgi:hypothetical protein